jgi:DNA polymerase I-like protein with 3'-5' exonuclease and polymerase domains
VETMRALVQEEMEEVTALVIPIVVDVQVGRNWNEAR